MTVQRGSMHHGHVLRWLTALALALELMVAGSPAEAAAGHPTATKVTAHALPATAHIGSVVVVSGVITPKAPGVATVQRLVGHSWRTIGHAAVSAKGAYTLSLRAPKTAISWTVRVTRAASRTAKAAASAAIHVHIVKPIYVVTAVMPTSVAAGQPIVVTGKVSPKAAGTVWLQGLTGGAWHNLASAKLTKTSTYTIRTLRPPAAITSASPRPSASQSPVV